MLLRHIGYSDKAERLEMALDICATFEQKVKITGRTDGATAEQYTAYLMEWIEKPELKAVWNKYIWGK